MLAIQLNFRRATIFRQVSPFYFIIKPLSPFKTGACPAEHTEFFDIFEDYLTKRFTEGKFVIWPVFIYDGYTKVQIFYPFNHLT